MLNQNWFATKNFVMFCDYTEYQLFYDTKSKNIYEVSEGVMDRANTTIREFTPENPEYRRLYQAYESFLNSSNKVRTGIYSVTFAAQVDVLVEAGSPKDAREKAEKMFGEYDETTPFHYTYLSDIMNVTDKDGNEV
mgnify:FL=1